MKTENANNKTFFRQFIKSGYFLLSLCLAALFFTAAAFLTHINAFDAISGNNSLFVFALFTAGYFILAAVAYIAVSSLKKGVSAGDSLSFACIVSSVLYLVYLFTVKKNFAPELISIAAFAAVFGAVFLIVSKIRFEKGGKFDKPNYIVKLLNRYSFFAILGAALFLALCDLLLWSGDYSAIKLGTGGYVCGAICLAVVLVSAAVCSANKKLNLFDLIFAAAVLVSPVIIFRASFLLAKGRIGGAHLAAAVAAALTAGLFFGLRFVNYKDEIDFGNLSGNNAFARYISAVRRDSDVFSAIGAGAIAALICTVLFPYAKAIELAPSVIGASFTEAIKTFAFIAVNAAIITGALVAFALAVVNVKAESVTIGDNALIYCTSFCAFALLGNLGGYAAEKVLVPAILFTFCLSVLITRVKTVTAYEN